MSHSTPVYVACPECECEEFRTTDDNNCVIQCCDCQASFRQLKRIAITPSMVATLASGIYRVVSNSELTDVRVVNVIYESDSDCFMLYLWSPEFDPIPIGAIIPELPSPVIERLVEMKP